VKQDKRDQPHDQHHGQQGQPQQQDRRQSDQGQHQRDMNKADDRDMGKNRNEEETGKPVQLGKEGKEGKEGKGGKLEPSEREGRGPQLP
jgi:hypothetical protein